MGTESLPDLFEPLPTRRPLHPTRRPLHRPRLLTHRPPCRPLLLWKRDMVSLGLLDRIGASLGLLELLLLNEKWDMDSLGLGLPTTLGLPTLPPPTPLGLPTLPPPIPLGL